MPAVVLTQRDHAFNLTVGDLASVRVMVPPDRVEDARDVLESEPLTDEELEEAALAADQDAPSAHSRSEDAMLDSAVDEIQFSEPDHDEEHKKE